MSLSFNAIDNLTGDVTLQEGYHTEIILFRLELVRILQSTSDEIHLGYGKKFVILPTANDDEKMYCVKIYNRDMTVRCSFSMTSAEWDCVVSHATNITYPPVNDHICTYCGDFVPISEHYGCQNNKTKMDAFLLTPLCERLCEAVVKETEDRYAYLMRGEESGFGIDYTILTKAYAYVKRQSVVDAIYPGIVEKGSYLTPNENILLYDTHFINFKMCVHSHIQAILKHNLGGDIQQEQSLDWPDDM